MLELYPINSFGPIMKGLAIGALGILHVFLAQFAIGGGMLMSYLQWRSMWHASETARLFTDSLFKFLVLVSFVVGAISGVAMWFTAIQVGPRTIGMMVDAFHWVWGIEWTFFCLEVVSGYAFYRYGKWLNDSARLALLLIYTLAAWFSLFWINGILAWQLTPGDWTQTHTVWAGFFNPGFWPSLFYRTVAALTIATLVALVVVNCMPASRDDRQKLVHELGPLLVPMLLMPLLGAWYVATMPEDSRGWALGGSPIMAMFLMMATGASILIGLYAALGLVWGGLYINTASALVLVCLAFGATAGGEFVREGVRKPFTIRGTLYSNGILISEVAELRKSGVTDRPDTFPLRDADEYPTLQLRRGAVVYRQLCSACHTLDGVNALDALTGSWTTEQKRLNIAQIQRTKPFMPPFAGTAAEVETLVQLLNWRKQGQPNAWQHLGESAQREVVARIQYYLDEAGTAPGSDFEHGRRQQSLMRDGVPSFGIASPPEGKTSTNAESGPPASAEETP